MCATPQIRFYSWGVLRSMTGAAWGEARNAGPARKKYISRVERTEKGEVKESNFFHCRDRRHLRNFSVSLSLPFQHSPLFGCGAASEQIKDERAEPNSFGVTVERDEGGGRRGSEGPFPSTLARRASRSKGHARNKKRRAGESTPKSKFQGKMETMRKSGIRMHASAKSPCM